MTLSDLRKVAVTRRVRIRFRAGGAECVIDEHGIARIPSLKSKPDFHLSRVLDDAGEFVLDPPGKPVTRAELAAMAAGRDGGEQTRHEEEE